MGSSGKHDDCRVIINGDDFGLSAESNAGIIRAYRAGVLSSTSLIINGDTVQNALIAARLNPGLAVGLHIALSDNLVKPILSPRSISMLVQDDGRFLPDESGIRSALRSIEGRRQLRAEIAAQFRAFVATGLMCDHVNAHRNAHLHPILAMLIFREAARWGVKAIRIPWDPPIICGLDVLRFIRFVALRRLGRHYKLRAPDRSIARPWDTSRLVELLSTLPAGSTEIYCHPIDGGAGKAFASDLPSLLDNRVRLALRGLTLCSYQTAIS